MLCGVGVKVWGEVWVWRMWSGCSVWVGEHGGGEGGWSIWAWCMGVDFISTQQTEMDTTSNINYIRQTEYINTHIDPVLSSQDQSHIWL